MLKEELSYKKRLILNWISFFNQLKKSEYTPIVYMTINQFMTKYLILVLISLLTASISLNLLQYSNTEIVCSKIDTRWKADLLYKLWHHKLDWDHDWIPCESLPYNQK